MTSATAASSVSRPPRFDPPAARAVAHGFDLKRLPGDFFADPFRYYHALREHDPVHRMPDGAYLITRYRDCEAVYKDARTFSSDKKVEFKPKYGDSLLYQHHTTSLVFNDPPLHTHVRRAIIGALSARAIAEMEAGLVDLVDRLIGRMAEQGRADLIEDFAAAIPVEIIGNLLDVPRAERAPLRGWSLAILGALEPVLTPEQLSRGNEVVRDFLDYLRGLVAERRRLIEQPDLAASAVEEVLRFESSNQLGNRIVAADTVLGGVAMP
ncbi:MAG TPA: cytochrome P450, partial [Xanthobacteraceae bacterium]|nr:cytochrome P450 [Xanthobacteraceae bacterium]